MFLLFPLPLKVGVMSPSFYGGAAHGRIISHVTIVLARTEVIRLLIGSSDVIGDSGMRLDISVAVTATSAPPPSVSHRLTIVPAYYRLPRDVRCVSWKALA